MDATNATKSTVDHFIRWAKASQMLATRKATHGMYVTILNYDTYQDMSTYRSDTESETKAKQKRHSLNKNDKNDKKEEKTPRKESTQPALKSILLQWNDFAVANDLSPIQSLTNNREKHLRARMREDFFDFPVLLKAVKGQPFLLGNNQKGWTCNFDWIINQANYVKILEGRYVDKKEANRYAGIKEWILDDKEKGK